MPELPETLRPHLTAPTHVGDLDPPCVEARGENAACGDELVLRGACRDGRVELRFRARACSAVIAVASYVLEELEGRPLAEIAAFDVEAAIDAAGGLPRHRQHATRVVGRALAEVVRQLED
ncbi:MAG: iron-sulfur cluster assembly scaffold protein [Planctomycetota bacterium]|jgi:NifU-like protein involved in Fe-S cluster formation